MPSDMRLQCPSEDTPPSTRPPSVASSAASTSGTPHRSTSMDSLHTNSSSSEKPSGEEYIPTRLIRPTPKVNANAMQFVKTGPANLHRSAKEQMKKVEVVKSLRKTSLQEEEEWQSNSTTMKSNSLEDGSDWQMNLDKWKSSRRKRNEDVLERVIEVKKNELDEEFSKTRRKSKTFSEMREDKTKRGRRYNLVVHDDDNNDLSDLGISTAKNGQSLSDAPEEGEAKSDAGFCTGSDTGSDGVFAEDNISDTSSALGDKREIHDSLLDSGSPPNTQKSSEVLLNGHHVNGTSVVTDTSISTCSVMSDEYTYDKAIEDYKQFAENSVKKRTSSVTSLSSNASGSKEEQEKSSSGKMSDDRFSSYDGGTREPKVIRRDRTAAKVDIGKRRSMFELREIDQQESQKADLRRSMDVSSKLRSKVASFENVNDSDSRTPTVKPVRDTKFKEKLESFSKKERFDNSSLSQRKTPERDQNFYQKLQNFTQMEAKTSMEILERKTSPERKHLRKSFDRKISPTRKSSDKIYDKRTPPPMPLKERIASFENLSPTSSPGKKELSISMENLNNKFTYSDESRVIQSSQSVTNLFRRTPSTPFMVVEVDEEMEEKACVKRNVTRDYEMKSSVHETLEKEKSTRTSLEKQSYEAPPLPEKTRPRSHIGITSRTLPEVPVSKPARILPEPPNIVPVSRAIPDTTKEVVSTKSPSESRTARTLPAVPKPQVPDISEPRIPAHSEVLPQVPPKEPEMILNWLPETSFSEDSHELSTRVPDVAPPPVPPPRVPTIEDPYTSLSSFTTTEDSKDYTYGDQDIDEVINNEISLESISSTNRGTFHENGYEKSPEIKMFEKVTETNENYTNGLEESHSHRHHQSSAEENFSLKAGRSPSPPLPPKNKNLAVFEGPRVKTSENSSTKQDLRKLRSNFLGTNPQVEEVVTLQPPPDLTELLRQERDAERLLVQKQANLKRESPMMDFEHSSGMSLTGRSKYTWEDRMKADGPSTERHFNDDSVDPFEFHTQLAELEQEMEKHDRDMLQRLKPPSIPETKEMYIDDTSEPIAQPSHYPDKLSSSREPEHYQEFNNSSNRNNQSIAKSSSTENSHTPVQEFYSAPVYKNEPTELNFNSRIKTSQENLYSDPPSVSREIKRVVEPSKSLPDVPPPVPRKQSILALSAIPKPKLTDNDSWIMKKKAEGTKKDYSKHWLIQEAEQRRLEQQERITRPMQLPINKQVNTLHTTQGFQNHFQNLKTSFHISPYNQSSGTNNATISNASNTLYNPPSPSNNYNNNSPSNTTSCPPPNNNWMKQTKTYQPQQPASPTAANNKPLPDAIISSITQRVNNKMNGRTPVYNSAHNNNSVRTEDNYHDYMNTGAFNSTYSSSGNSTSNTSPVSASSGGTPQGSHISTHLPSLSSQQGISGSQQGTLSDDQRLLSVSGKKKCSHCSEELGRGAAMIIESLRLFYHIPCFKCCVCGIQLGNGTSGADVRVRNHKLHCHNCYSNDEGMKFSKV